MNYEFEYCTLDEKQVKAFAYNLKNEVKSRVIKENLAIWLGDYPTDTLIEDDIRNGYGKIIKDNDKIIGYAACHLSETEYSMDAFCYKKLYTFFLRKKYRFF